MNYDSKRDMGLFACGLGKENIKIEDVRINCEQNSLVYLVSGPLNADIGYSKEIELKPELISKIRYTENGLIPVVTQDFRSGKVLIVSFATKEAVENTIKTGNATYWKRSKNMLWIKGATSGDFLKVNEIIVNENKDFLIYHVTPLGKGACHTKDFEGNPRDTCYYRSIVYNNGLFSLKYI